MLDEASIRRNLSEVENRLAHMDDERAALQEIAKGYRALLKALAPPDQTSPEPPTFPKLKAVGSADGGARGGKSSTVVGTVSMRATVARVLQDARGPLHSRDIFERAHRLGAATTAKDPTSVVDLVVLDLSKKGLVEKVGPRTWVWRR